MKALNFQRCIGCWFCSKAATLRAVIILTLFAGLFVAQAETATNSPAAATEYARWTKSWAERPMTNSIPGGPELKAVVSIVQGEAPLSAMAKMTKVQRLYVAYRIRVVGAEITTNGYCRCYFTSNTDARSASLNQLSAGELKQLNDILNHLPDDHQKLPPPGKRIVVQVLENQHWQIHVYDGNDLPPQIHSLLALIHNPFYQLQ